MFQPLDGPSKQTKLSVTTSTPVEVKVGSSPLAERKAITMQPDGNMKVYFADEGETPSAATVLNNGFNHFKNTKETYEASDEQVIFILSASGTIDVVIAERA